MTNDGGGPGDKNNWQGDIGGLSHKDSQCSLGGINDADRHSHFSSQLAKGVIGAHIAIAQVPNVTLPE
jgi:hypothetical protein